MESGRDLTILSIEVKCLIKLLQNKVSICPKCCERLTLIGAECIKCWHRQPSIERILNEYPPIPFTGKTKPVFFGIGHELYLATLSNKELLRVLPEL